MSDKVKASDSPIDAFKAAWSENQCGDELCEGARLHAVLSVLKGDKTHRQYADLIALATSAALSAPATEAPAPSAVERAREEFTKAAWAACRFGHTLSTGGRILANEDAMWLAYDALLAAGADARKKEGPA